MIIFLLSFITVTLIIKYYYFRYTDIIKSVESFIEIPSYYAYKYPYSKNSIHSELFIKYTIARSINHGSAIGYFIGKTLHNIYYFFKN